MLQLLTEWARAVLFAAIAALVMAWPAVGPAQAGMVSTESVIEAAEAQAGARARVEGFPGRAEVRRHLETLGVEPDEAAARVESLSDEEIAMIAGQLDELPAGAEAVPVEIIVGVLLVLLLIVLLI